MHTKKKIWIGAGTLGGVAVLGIGGITAAGATDSTTESDKSHDKPLTGSVLTRASDAAVKAAGGGKVTETEHSDDAGAAYEVEVMTTGGTEVEVHLDKDFKVIKKETEAPDSDDKPLTGSVLTRASDAAVKAAGGGKVTETEHSDDAGAAYEVEVMTTGGTEVEVQLDKDFKVIKKETDTD